MASPLLPFEEGIKISITATIIMSVIYCAHSSVQNVSNELAEQLVIVLQWSAATVVLISAPFLGKTSIASLERMLGSIVGTLTSRLTHAKTIV